MIVISDTTPLSNFLQIGRLELSKALYETVIIPKAVYDELSALEELGVSIQPIRDADWITIIEPEDTPLIQQLLAHLDFGEAQAIVLAMQFQPDYLLIDEKEGRAKAEEFDLPFIGTLGSWLKAKNAGLIESLQEEMDRLNEVGFWIRNGD